MAIPTITSVTSNPLQPSLAKRVASSPSQVNQTNIVPTRLPTQPRLSVGQDQSQQELSTPQIQPTQPRLAVGDAEGNMVNPLNSLSEDKKRTLSNTVKEMERRQMTPEQIKTVISQFIDDNQTPYTPPISTPEPEKVGFGQSLVRGITNVPLRAAATGAKVIAGGFETLRALGNKITGDEAGQQQHSQRAAEILNPDTPIDFGYLGKVKPLTLRSPGEGALKSFADTAGAGFEAGSMIIGGGGAGTLAKQSLSGLIKQGVKSGVGYGATSGVLGGLGSGLQREDANFANVTTDTLVGGALGSILGLAGGFAGPLAGKAGNAVAGKLVPNLKVNSLKNSFYRAVDDNFGKVFKPSATIQKNTQQIANLTNKARLGVATILDHIPEGQALPETLEEGLEYIGKTKSDIFKQFDSQAQQAGTKGAVIELKDISEQLIEIANDPRINDITPETAKYARTLAKKLQDRKSYSPQVAQDVLASLNARLKTFYRNSNPNSANDALIDNFVANNIRTKLDEAIAAIQDPSYQKLRLQYGALSELETMLSRRLALRNNRPPKGFFDFADVLSSGEVIQGVLSGNPALVAKGLAIKTIGSTLKFLNDPDRLFAKMMRDADKPFRKIRKEILPTPETRFRLQLAAGKPGRSVSINTPINQPRSIRPLEGGSRARREVNPSFLLPEKSTPLPIDRPANQLLERVGSDFSAERSVRNNKRIGGRGSRRTNQGPGIGVRLNN